MQLAEPDDIEPHSLGGVDLGKPVGEGLRMRVAGRAAELVEHAEFHRPFSLPNRRERRTGRARVYMSFAPPAPLSRTVRPRGEAQNLIMSVLVSVTGKRKPAPNCQAVSCSA